MGQVHSFHIPVMGTGFTIDTPLKVARYGISSVMSVDDNLMEKMREYYSSVFGEPYEPIPKYLPDSRARRITEYLDFVGRIVARQIEAVKASPFERGSEITKYFELLEDGSPLKEEYKRMLVCPNKADKLRLQEALRAQVTAGSIDVNILTKLDREHYRGGQKLPREYSDAMAALKGFAQSRYGHSIVLSAGLNLHLFSYAEHFDDFYADSEGRMKKKIVLKVSDYRSAFTQGKIFAKKGIWVSEYRIESGLNCGGHAFATAGHLLGPVLEEFKQRRREFAEQLFEVYQEAILEKKGLRFQRPLPFRITAQGGIGTSQENKFLTRYYELDGTGWGTPFLLVPEATSVDPITLERLCEADEEDVYLSDASPMGVPIYNLRTSVSEQVRLERIRNGQPGSPCLNGFMSFNTEFTKIPICVASHAYQKMKIAQLKNENLPEPEFREKFERVVEKACVCHDLGDGALAKYGLRYPGYEIVPAVCPGPNIVYFSKVMSLREMVDHIYGRINVLGQNKSRPHVLINELRLYVNHLRKLVQRMSAERTAKERDFFLEFRKNLMDGIEYYKGLVHHFLEESEQSRDRFLQDLAALAAELEGIQLQGAIA